MKISETEKLNLSIIHGSRAYSQWEQDHDLPDYLVVIMYELLIRGKLTQRELVNLSDLPKQSINKGIKILRDHDHITMTVDPSDKRVRFCRICADRSRRLEGYAHSRTQIQQRQHALQRRRFVVLRSLPYGIYKRSRQSCRGKCRFGIFAQGQYAFELSYS